MNLGAIRRELAALIADGAQWNTYFHTPKAYSFPAVVIEAESIDYAKTYAGKALVRFRVSVYASIADSRQAQELIDEALSFGTANSIASAVHGARGQSFSSAKVMGADNFRMELVEGQPVAYAADIYLEIHT